MQVKRYDRTFSKQELYGIQVHSTKQNLVSFQTPRELRHSITNEQSGFNVEQIKKDKYPGSKIV